MRGCEGSYHGAWTLEGSGKVLILQRIGQDGIGDRQVYHGAGSLGGGTLTFRPE